MSELVASLNGVNKLGNQAPLQRLWHYGANHRGQTIFAIVMSITKKILDIVPEILIGVAIDVIVSSEDSFVADVTGITDRWQQLLILAVLNFVVWVGESLAQFALNVSWRTLAQDIQHEARLDAYANVQNLDLAYFDDASTGELLSILNDDVNQLERFLDEGANKMIQMGINVLGVGLLFLIVSPLITLVAFLPIPFLLFGSFSYQKRLVKLYDTVRARVGNLSTTLQNNLSGITTIKAFNTEDTERKRVEEISQTYRDANAAAIKLSSAFVPLIRVAILIGFSATLLLGGWMAINGDIRVGSYSLLVFMTQRMLWPLTDLGSMFDTYQRAMSSVRRILDLVDTEPQIQEGLQALPVNGQGSISFENLSFGYSANHPVLKNVSFQVPAGETHAIVGTTGSGKSTLVKLLLNLYSPTAGEISIDGVPVRDVSNESLRAACGLVSQDVFLFDGSVRDNISYGLANPTGEEVTTAAKLCEAHEFISKLPNGYDTVVGERGQKLSGGQRQRISIARAILRDPKILILDEATSSVDNETEAAISRSLDVVAKDRTTVVIAHRLSTIRNADRIHVLESGSISESGTHEELLEIDGLYRALWMVQTGERSA